MPFVAKIYECIVRIKAQVLSYLKATGLKLGTLLNFGSRKVKYKRIVN